MSNLIKPEQKQRINTRECCSFGLFLFYQIKIFRVNPEPMSNSTI